MANHPRHGGWLLSVACLFACLFALPAAAQQWHWFGPFSLVPSNNLSVETGSPGVAARFTTSAAGDLQWVYMGLPLPAGTAIDSVTVCYELNNTSTFISQVRITRMGAPDAAVILVDLGADLHSATPTCVAQGFPAIATPQQGMCHLALRLDFASTAHFVEIGAIGVHVTSDLTAIEDDQSRGEFPAAPRLAPNAPNPFNPSTRISFTLDRDEPVKLAIYNVDGARVRTLLDEPLAAGEHVHDWDGRDDQHRLLPSGIYLYQLTVAGQTESRRMALIR